MQPIRIKIIGEFWDSFIYKGKLFLLFYNKKMCVYDWDKICKYIHERYDNSFGFGIHYGLQHGGELYSQIKILKPKILKKIISDFTILGEIEIVLQLNELIQFILKETSIPFSERPNDLEFFKDVFYAATNNGIETCKLSVDKNILEISNDIKRITDVPTIHIRATYGGRIALSSGDEGLFEYTLANVNHFGVQSDHNLNFISKRHSSFADWNYSSLYNSSDEGDSYLLVFQRIFKADLAEFIEKSGVEIQSLDQKKDLLELKYEVSQEEIFSKNGSSLSWGGGNKIYCWSDSKLFVTTYSQYQVSRSNSPYELFSNVSVYDFNRYQDVIISGGVSFFGIIVELENRLIIIDSSYKNSTDSLIEVSQPVGRWRTYPRSERYDNQLHVITEDYMEIFAFTSDFFREQRHKDLGMSWSEFKS